MDAMEIRQIVEKLAAEDRSEHPHGWKISAAFASLMRRLKQEGTFPSYEAEFHAAARLVAVDTVKKHMRRMGYRIVSETTDAHGRIRIRAVVDDPDRPRPAPDVFDADVNAGAGI